MEKNKSYTPLRHILDIITITHSHAKGTAMQSQPRIFSFTTHSAPIVETFLCTSGCPLSCDCTLSHTSVSDGRSLAPPKFIYVPKFRQHSLSLAKKKQGGGIFSNSTHKSRDNGPLEEHGAVSSQYQHSRLRHAVLVTLLV